MKNLFKRTLLCFFVTTAAYFSSYAQQSAASEGKFKPTDESLKQYQYPEWFRDAKFGIWAHWGPQAVPRKGDWYARKMYQEGSATYKYHLGHYGHPSKFGYKDIIPLWKAEKWDPEKLMALYKKAGAKYFVSMGSHHDNFFLWNSKIHNWNSVKMGPHKDVVGIWQKAAQAQGLRFGISEHLAKSYDWFQPSHGSDTTGPYTGIPYDGADPRYQDLYHTKANPLDVKNKLNNGWPTEWLSDVEEIIDNYHPDLLYSDSGLPFGVIGRQMLAHYYNADIAKNNGKLDAVYNCKQSSEGKWVRDVERGVLDSISPYPWQTDTSIGDWFYSTGQKYKSADAVTQLLIDIISKNGNLLINVVQTPEGDLEPDVLKIVENIAVWTAANGEGVYATRPWKVYGEGPSTIKENQVEKGHFGGLSDFRPFQATDIRYTVKGDVVYAFCLDTPTTDIRMVNLGKNSKYLNRPIKAVTLLGSKETIVWKQQNDALVITKPTAMPAWQVQGFKVEFKK